MTLPFVSGSRASIATPHVDPANVPLPASRPSSRRSSAAGESSVDLPKLADQGKRTAHPQTRRGIGALPPALHLAIAAHLPLADVVSFAKTDKQINGALRDRTNHLQADYVTLSGHIDAAQSLADLHTIANSLHRDTVPFETVCAKIGLKISRMIGTITVAGTANALPDADRAAEIHRCLSTYAQMEPAALRAAGLGRAIGMAKSVPTADHQGVFDEGVAKMKATVPASERGPVLNALIAVTTTSDYDGTGPASERVAANIGQVLENMDGLSDAAKTQLVMTAMKQTKELCEPGWSEAMRAVGTAYQKLHAA
jgi:hypothetical protein